MVFRSSSPPPLSVTDKRVIKKKALNTYALFSLYNVVIWTGKK